MELFPNRILIELSQIAFPMRVLPKDDRTDSFREERLGLPQWTMILAICALVDVSTYLDILTLDFFNNVDASLHVDLSVSGYFFCCLSWTSWKPWYNVHDFCGCHLRCWWSLFSEYCIRTRIIFYNVTSEYDPSFVLLILRFQLRILEMTEIHQWRKMNFSALSPWFIDHLFLISDFRQLRCRNFSSIFLFFLHCRLCIWNS